MVLRAGACQRPSGWVKLHALLSSTLCPHSFHAPLLNSLTLGLERQRLHLLEGLSLSVPGG